MAWAIGLSTPINLLAQFTDIASVCPLRPVKCRNYFYNRGNFEIFAYSNSTDDGSPMRRRIASAFDKLFDIRGIPDKIAADMIHADGIDILVGLKGYTTDDRGPILAYRPAPVQAQFLGYPGTMGTASVDYLIAVRRNLPSNWLGLQPDALIALKAKVQAKRHSATLFDIARFTRHLEHAYSRMWTRYVQGKAPEFISIPGVGV